MARHDIKDDADLKIYGGSLARYDAVVLKTITGTRDGDPKWLIITDTAGNRNVIKCDTYCRNSETKSTKIVDGKKEELILREEYLKAARSSRYKYRRAVVESILTQLKIKDKDINVKKVVRARKVILIISGVAVTVTLLGYTVVPYILEKLGIGNGKNAEVPANVQAPIASTMPTPTPTATEAAISTPAPTSTPKVSLEEARLINNAQALINKYGDLYDGKEDAYELVTLAQSLKTQVEADGKTKEPIDNYLVFELGLKIDGYLGDIADSEQLESTFADMCKKVSANNINAAQGVWQRDQGTFKYIPYTITTSDPEDQALINYLMIPGEDILKTAINDSNSKDLTDKIDLYYGRLATTFACLSNGKFSYNGQDLPVGRIHPGVRKFLSIQASGINGYIGGRYPKYQLPYINMPYKGNTLGVASDPGASATVAQIELLQRQYGEDSIAEWNRCPSKAGTSPEPTPASVSYVDPGFQRVL